MQTSKSREGGANRRNYFVTHRREGGVILDRLLHSVLSLAVQAVRKCVERLWLVHQDFLKHVAGEQWSHPVLFRYQHMFKGIKASR